MAMAAGLVGATLSVGVLAATGNLDRGTTVVERNVAIQPVTSIDATDDTVAAIAARTAPTIAALRIDRDGTSTPATAIVLRSDGHLITSAHAVEGADTIEVHLHGGAIRTASVVGADRTTDIAVLHVDEDGLAPAAIGTAEGVAVGDRAIAIGLADTGSWETELTTGFIRGIDRKLRRADSTVLHDMILLDTMVGHGAIGGPLLDASGAVVGITHALTGAEGDAPALASNGDVHGVASPIELATRVADQIIEHGRARHVWLGVEGTDAASDVAKRLDVAGGASVTEVAPHGPAAAAGFEEGDVIVAVDGTPVESMSDLIASLRAHEPDDEVTMTVCRGDQELAVPVVLAEKSR